MCNVHAFLVANLIAHKISNDVENTQLVFNNNNCALFAKNPINIKY